MKHCAKENGIACILFGNKFRNAHFMALTHLELHTLIDISTHCEEPRCLRSWLGPFGERSTFPWRKNCELRRTTKQERKTRLWLKKNPR